MIDCDFCGRRSYAVVWYLHLAACRGCVAEHDLDAI